MERERAGEPDQGAPRHGRPTGDEPTQPLAAPTAPATGIPDVDGGRPGLHVRLFGSREFFRLWLAQVVSALGDWLGFLAITVLAARISSNPEAAIGLVMSARIIPGFFLAPVMGVLVDRWNRKKVMVTCDIGRAAVLACLPFVSNVTGLVVASLVLEVFTLLWAPAKEASVPNLVPPDRLTTANSLSLAAAYGTFPFASALFAALAGIGAWLSGIDILGPLQVQNQETLAFYVDVMTFLASAALISRLHLPHRGRDELEEARHRRLEFGEAFRELKEGWRYIFLNPTVRAVNLGMAVALIGGGMLVPLGPVFSSEVLGAGEAGFGLFLTALGFGGAVGVIGVSAFQRRLPAKTTVFSGAVIAAGVSLFIGASVTTLGLSALCVFGLGMFAGTVYVIGFTLLHESVEDELRGRIFSALYTLVRLCVLLAFALGPFLAAFLGGLSDAWFGGEIEVGGITIAIPGVRLTLWLASIIIVGAGVIASRTIRGTDRSRTNEEPEATGG